MQRSRPGPVERRRQGNKLGMFRGDIPRGSCGLGQGSGVECCLRKRLRNSLEAPEQVRMHNEAGGGGEGGWGRGSQTPSALPASQGPTPQHQSQEPLRLTKTVMGVHPGGTRVGSALPAACACIHALFPSRYATIDDSALTAHLVLRSQCPQELGGPVTHVLAELTCKY